MRQLEKNYKRIVVKIGSSLLRRADNQLDLSFLREVVNQVSSLNQEKKDIVLVSSGAILLGLSVLGLGSRPSNLAYLQAVAAIGQNELMSLYGKFFKRKAVKCAQILLTWEDFDNRQRYLNAKNTLNALLKLESVPIINENDTVATDEIKFGDNDRLSAMVACLINADLLIILSDVDGLLNKNQKTVIKLVEDITPEISSYAASTDKKTSVGGMITKLQAAKMAINSGIPCVIANGREKDIIVSLVNEPSSYGTIFLPKKIYLNERKRWIAFSTKPKGKITVDEGAKQALLNQKSLLCVGIVACEGFFEEDDIVSVVDKHNHEFARGKIRISSKQLDKVKGCRYHKEIIHRDNIVVL